MANQLFVYQTEIFKSEIETDLGGKQGGRDKFGHTSCAFKCLIVMSVH